MAIRRSHTVLSVVGHLPAREQLVFSLRNLESMTVEEIAEVMQISASTVALGRARDGPNPAF